MCTTSLRVEDFIYMATGKSVEALATRMEAYNVAGVTGKFKNS